MDAGGSAQHGEARGLPHVEERHASVNTQLRQATELVDAAARAPKRYDESGRDERRRRLHQRAARTRQTASPRLRQMIWRLLNALTINVTVVHFKNIFYRLIIQPEPQSTSRVVLDEMFNPNSSSDRYHYLANVLCF